MGLFNWLFRQACNKVFNMVDYNKNGKIEALEIEVAVLHLYNMFNKRLPGWEDPPSRATILAALKEFDTDSDGTLDQAEFEKFARDLLKNGPDQFFSRIGKNALTQTAILPAASIAVREVAKAAGANFLSNTPLAVLAPTVGVVFNAVRSLLPF